MGAWIEIACFSRCRIAFFVAPLVGAWIEIYTYHIYIYLIHVAPLVGAWIEITKRCRNTNSHTPSLLSWERGLKSMLNLYSVAFNDVAPLVGAWIEIWHKSRHKVRWKWSLLSWERGLKLKNLNTNDCVIWSLLSWERGLKFCKVSGCACTCRRSSRGSVN